MEHFFKNICPYDCYEYIVNMLSKFSKATFSYG